MDEVAKHIESDETDKPKHDESGGNSCKHFFKLVGKRDVDLVQCTVTKDQVLYFLVYTFILNDKSSYSSSLHILSMLRIL